MKITFTDQQNIAKQISGLSDAVSLAKFKRDINIGGSRFLAALGREYNRQSRFTDMEAGQQYYQMPMDAQKLKELVVSLASGDPGYRPPLEQIPDEFAWNMMNMLSVTGQPSHYWVRGNNEFGLYPTPADSIEGGIQMVFSPKHVQLTEDDFTTGTIAITQGTTVLTHSATGFTPKMVGMWFQNTDGSDENWYQIAEYTSPSVLQLGNNYQGLSVSTSTFRIGQVMDLPEEFLEAPVDYAMYRFYLRRGNPDQAGDFKAIYQDALDMARNTYGNTTDSQVISAEPLFRTYNPFRGDPPASISA